jgi:site-specific DNA-cytosine methylase
MDNIGLNVLSLFDGMSCGRIALDRVGIKVTNYFASEIDKYAIKVSQHNWDDITHIGDVTKISFAEGVLYTEAGEFQVGSIDLVIAGSPCQGFSMAGKQLAFDDERSKLYFVFERILKEIQAENPEVKFLLENVKMKQEYKDVISERLGVSPVAINSNLVSAQNRYRLYWTNICEITQPQDKGILLKDILQDVVDSKYSITHFVGGVPRSNYMQFNLNGKGNNSQSQRCYYVTSKSSCLDCTAVAKIIDNDVVRKLTPEECEKLQTVPVGYTSCVSDSQRYKMLGNGWTVDVVAHIFKGIKEE